MGTWQSRAPSPPATGRYLLLLWVLCSGNTKYLFENKNRSSRMIPRQRQLNSKSSTKKGRKQPVVIVPFLRLQLGLGRSLTTARQQEVPRFTTSHQWYSIRNVVLSLFFSWCASTMYTTSWLSFFPLFVAKRERGSRDATNKHTYVDTGREKQKDTHACAVHVGPPFPRFLVLM